MDELRNYHRDEDFRVVRQRDDMVRALRYAIMMRRHGKALQECEGIGHGGLLYAVQRPGQGAGEQQFALGSISHPTVGPAIRGPAREAWTQSWTQTSRVLKNEI